MGQIREQTQRFLFHSCQMSKHQWNVCSFTVLTLLLGMQNRKKKAKFNKFYIQRNILQEQSDITEFVICLPCLKSCWHTAFNIRLHGKEGALHYIQGAYLSFYQKWSKLCTLFQTNANEAKIKKKLKTVDSMPSYRTQFCQCRAEFKALVWNND